MTSRRPARSSAFLTLLAVACSLGTVLPAQAQTPTEFFLHGTGPDNNPPTLVLDTTAPTATSAKFVPSACPAEVSVTIRDQISS